MVVDREELEISEGDDSASCVSESSTESCEGDEVLLGFLEVQETKQALLRDKFPCKAGGKPAWLNPEDLPDTDTLVCGRCEKRLSFLLQLYAPLAEFEHAFHRMLYVFVCDDGECSGVESRYVK